MIIAIISIIFVLAVVAAIVMPMIFHPKQLKDHCDSDADCGKDQRCILDPNTNKNTCVEKGKKFCSMFTNNLTACNISTDDNCKECAIEGGQDLSWSCQSSLWNGDKPRNSCIPPGPGKLEPCPGPGPCPTGCNKGEICIDGTGVGPGGKTGRCSLPRTWHKSKIYCTSDPHSTDYNKNCETACSHILGEYDATAKKCITFEETTIPPGTVQPTSKKCTKDSDCTEKGELCARGFCSQVKGWCQIPMAQSNQCNEFTGTYTLRQEVDVDGKIVYKWVCLCDTNLFDLGVGEDCTNLVACGGETQQTGKYVYIPELTADKKVIQCSDTTNCKTTGAICQTQRLGDNGNKICYIPWDSSEERSPYPCTSDGDKENSCGFGVTYPKHGGSTCNCGNEDILITNQVPGSPASKRWIMACKNKSLCEISGGADSTGVCKCSWPLKLDKNSCIPDPCFPGYSTDEAGCFCPNKKLLCEKTKNSTKCKDGGNQNGGPTPKSGDRNIINSFKNTFQDFWPSVGDSGEICQPMCGANSPCGDKGFCNPMRNQSGTYNLNCDCLCGSEGIFCQYASSDNKVPRGELCNIEDGSDICCDAPPSSPGVKISASDDKNPCVVGRLSPFWRAGLSREDQILDNNSDGNHDGNKLGFCYKPCKPSPGPGSATSDCGDDEVCVKLPKNAWKGGVGGDKKNYYCTKKIKNFKSSPGATESCYANSFVLADKDLCTLGSDSAPTPSSGPGGVQNKCSVYTGGNASVYNPPQTSPTASSLCCFNNPRGINHAETPLPSCSYNCDSAPSSVKNPQPNCASGQYLNFSFWDDTTGT